MIDFLFYKKIIERLESMIKIVKKEIKVDESLISRLKSKIEDLKALITY